MGIAGVRVLHQPHSHIGLFGNVASLFIFRRPYDLIYTDFNPLLGDVLTITVLAAVTRCRAAPDALLGVRLPLPGGSLPRPH